MFIVRVCVYGCLEFKGSKGMSEIVGREKQFQKIIFYFCQTNTHIIKNVRAFIESLQ